MTTFSSRPSGSLPAAAAAAVAFALLAPAALAGGDPAVAARSAAREDFARRVLPVTAPRTRIEGTLDLATGRFRRVWGGTGGVVQLGSACEGPEVVYDNTCETGGYFGLLPAGPGGTGSAHAQMLGDFGAIPSTSFPGDASCTTGCADDYEITRFEIAWCQVAGPASGSVIELEFWNTPESACQLGTAPGNNPTGGTRPPTTPTVFATTLTGLPRNNAVGTLACYVLGVTLTTPGFDLNGSSSFSAGSFAGDKFAWGFTMPTSTGADGPLLAGDAGAAPVCAPCVGSIWEVGGQTTGRGTGAGQDGAFFLESYGGTLTPPSTDCALLGTAGSPSGMHLELVAETPCVFACSFISFCDVADGSLAACPCAPGSSDTGCDVPIPAMQGGGLTGGVNIVPIAQRVAPENRATALATGFPAGTTPSGVLMRNTGIDPGSPVVFGDGVRCVDASASPGTFARLGASIAAGGSMECTFGHASMAGGGTFFYQLWFRSNPASYCEPSAAFNLSNGFTLDW